LDGVPASAGYGFRFGGADWLYQSGRDPQFDHLRVGRLLIAHTIRCACEDGIGMYHLLRGSESYKAEFADRDVGLQTVVRARGVHNGAALAALRVASARYPKLLKRWS
jgi:CelD/BcsL family acetyltransferase involved in cellulose biosynthesis